MKKNIFIILTFLLLISLSGCNKELYKVTFIGYNNEVIETIEVSKKDEVKYPTPIDVEGYNFVNWDKNVTYIEEDTTITAIYEIKTFKVTFYDENNQVLETKMVNYNDSISYTHKFNKEGYKFTGWNQSLKNIKSDLNVYPLFEICKYNVSFTDFYGVVVSEELVEYNQPATAPQLVEIEGYEFIGWDQTFTNVSSSMEIKPIYNRIKFTVTFYDEKGEFIEEQLIEYGESCKEVVAPTKDGYNFVRWDENLTNIKQNLDVYPIYEEIKIDKFYEVRFLDMYDNVIETQNIKEGESAISPVAPNIPYHTFKEWDTDFSKVNKDMTVKAIYRKDTNTFFNTTADYWLCILSSNNDINNPLLTEEEIGEYNKKILSNYTATEVKDVLAISNSATGSYVKGMIDQYTNINKYTIYHHDTKTAISSTEKQNILNNRDYSNIPTNVNVKYGIITDFAWLRSYPTNHYSNNYSMDRFQETSLNVGEGVAIYHTSLDQEWYFVQAENYNGWLEKKYVAECDYETLKDFLKPEERVLVISDYVKIEGSHVRMGQAFPLVKETSDSYTIKFPTRNSDGTLNLKELTVEIGNDYHKGYLTYNYYNVFTQAFKLLGIDYSWGDKDPLGRDCSSTMNAIYKCFGFMMPRNTTNQVATPTYGSKVSGLTNSSIQNYKPGTLIFTSSHVMLYLGVDAKGVAYLLHNTTSGDGACILQSLDSYGGSRINGVLRLQ